jgi:hypothetical protein
MTFSSKRLQILMSSIHRNTGRRSYPSAANDTIFLLDQLCRRIWSMLDCISYSTGVPAVPLRLPVTRMRDIPKQPLLQLTFKATFTLHARHASTIPSRHRRLFTITVRGQSERRIPTSGPGVSSVDDCFSHATERALMLLQNRCSMPISTSSCQENFTCWRDSLRVE